MQKAYQIICKKLSKLRKLEGDSILASTMQAMQRFVWFVMLSMAMTAAAQGPAAAPALPTTPTSTPAAPAPVAGTTNITGVLAKAGQFNTFIRLLRSTGVAEQIDNQLNSSRNGMTVFAPTDNAFTSLPSGTLNSLSDQQKNSLVQFHVLSTLIPMSQFDTVSNPLRTQAGNNSPGQYPLNVTAEGQQVNISTGVVNATVDNSLYTGDNLVVYQVNKVLLPMAIYGTPAPAPAPLAPAKKKGKTPASSVAEAPEAAADATPDATTSLAATGPSAAGVGMVLAMAVVWLAL